ncbi:hypothetical protein [Bradyrhizobium cenepequi]
MTFTLTDLEAELKALAPGAACCIHHDTFADLFPPGEPDIGARGAAYEFAKANGCTIDNRPAEQTLCFVKSK